MAAGRNLSRREAVTALGAVAIAHHWPSIAPAHAAANPATAPEVALAHVSDAALASTGRLRQSVARWCFARTPITTLCEWARELGLAGVDLLDEPDWGTPSQYGLTCAIGNSFGSIPRGFNRTDHHDALVAAGSAMIPKAAAAGVERIVVFSGNRGGLSDGEGIANCITGLKRLMPLAEAHGVTLCMEMLNSKVDHKDYHADHTAWAAQVVAGVDSPRFRLLYDIYHMQVMEGDVIATIRRYAPIIAHYHTAGVPGRNEIDDLQELNYARIAAVIADTGFDGFVAHEFLPRRDAKQSLQHAITVCTV